MADRSMIMLAVIATVLVLYVIKQERMSGKKMDMKAKKANETVGKARKPRASLGSSLGSSDCTNVDIDSPNFTRCSLGSGRSVIRSKPRGDSLNHAFKEDNYEVRGGALGNPFAVKLDDNFNKDTDRKLGAKAFPFSKSGALPKYPEVEAMRNKSMKYAQKPLNPQQKEHRGHKFDKIHKAQRMVVEAPSRGSSRASVSLGASVSTVDGMGYNEAFLGAAVSPSTLGATPEEIAQSTNKLDDINEVASNTGGNLNLLHPL